ncbi:MAG: DegT/DnrJ/EryC1/StrS family aminotransferase [Rhodoglobus sp.]
MTEARQPVPLNDLSRGIARDAAAMLDATRRVFESGYVVQGPEHALFEKELAAYLAVEHAIGLASGTDALELAMKAAMPPGRSTIVTAANAGGYSTTAARRAGFTVSYADVDEDSLCLDVNALDGVLTDDVGVVVVTHLYGLLTDIDDLLALCRDRGVRVLEDCAQSIGARRGSRMAGTWGDIAAISFYPTKNLGAMGDGGAVVTSNGGLAARVRQLRQYGWDEKYHVELQGGVNSRLDELQAAYLRLRLPQLDGFNERRREIVSRYGRAATRVDRALLQILPADGPQHVAHLAVGRSTKRDDVRRQLLDLGVRTDVHFPVPDYDQPGFAVQRVTLPVTSRVSGEVLSLPCFPEMTEQEIDDVCAAIGALR